MIDRESRDKLIKLIKSFMNDEIKSDQFDKEMSEITWNSNDELVSSLHTELWGLYDDWTDHYITLSKDGWDYLNRVILLLESDLESQYSPGKYPYLPVAIGITLLLVYGLVVYFGGILITILTIHIPIAIYLHTNLPTWLSLPRKDMRYYPFPSYSLLAKTRRKIAHFRKQKYKKELGNRKFRTASEEFVMKVMSFIGVIISGPFLLMLFSILANNGETIIVTQQENTIPC